MHAGAGSRRRPPCGIPDRHRPWIGANFWSRTGGPRMWMHYSPRVVRQELEVLAEHGCNVTRSFCYWPDFMPAPEQLDDDVLARFSDFLDAHTELGLGTIPTFIVGHMSGENWDPAWRHGRDLYRDVWLVSQQAWFAEEIARRFGGHPAVVGWLVSNEMPIYGGPATSDEVTAWARILVQAVRSAGATQPISLGDGAWGVEVSGSDNGYSLRRLAPLVDFVGPHVYPMEDDEVRQLLTAAFTCELAGSFGKPVVLEEFGVSSDFASDEHAADVLPPGLAHVAARGRAAAGSPGTTATTTTSGTRTRTATTSSSSISASPTAKAARSRSCASSPSSPRSSASCRRPAGSASPARPRSSSPSTSSGCCRSRTRRTAATSVTTSCRRYVAAREADLPVELRARARRALRHGAALPESLREAPDGAGARSLADARRRTARPSTPRTSPAARRASAGRGWPGSTRSSACATSCATASSTRSSRTKVIFRFVDDLGDIPAGVTPPLPRRRRAQRPRLPARRGGRRGGRRRRRPGPTRVAAARGRLRLRRPLHVSDRAHGGADAGGEPREHLAHLLGARRAAGVARPVRVDDPRVLVGRIRCGELRRRRCS